MSRAKGCSPLGERIVCIRTEYLSCQYSVSCIVSLYDPVTIFCDYRDDSNDQEDFFDFITQAVLAEYLRLGDILVCDNAAVHARADILKDLQGFVLVQRRTLLFPFIESPHKKWRIII